MTEQNPSSDPGAAYTADYQRLWDATVATLTAAVQLHHPQHGAVDFAGFLASALGAVAANVGSAGRLTAGRPGSWESDALDQLVGGTVGNEADAMALASRRTAPVLVPLNVAQLITEAYQDAPAQQRDSILAPIDDAVAGIHRPREQWNDTHPEPAADAATSQWEAYYRAYDTYIAQVSAGEETLRSRYAATFEAYAAAFTAAVLDEASTIGLSVPVEVTAQTDPEASWSSPGDTTNPDEYGVDDALAWHLWSAANARVPAPRVLIDTPTEATEQGQP